MWDVSLSLSLCFCRVSVNSFFFIFVQHVCFLLQNSAKLQTPSVSPSLYFPTEDDVVSMADSTITVDDIEGELFKIERIRDVLVRRESELRYM